MFILRMSGSFALLMAIALCAPIIVAVLYMEYYLLPIFLIPLGVCIAFAVPVFVITRAQVFRISINAGFLFVTIYWFMAGFIGALPYHLAAVVPTFADALFESLSGFSTTGASVLTDIESLPRALLFWRSQTHWLGGMGIIVLVIAVSPLLRTGGHLLVSAEVTGLTVDKTVPTIGNTAKILWFTYMILTAAEIILLRIFGMDLFDAFTHAFGTMATGGFSPKNASIGHYTSLPIRATITFFMILAGINFNLYYRLLYRRSSKPFRDPEFRVYITIIVVASSLIAFSLILHGGRSFNLNTAITAIFHTASILTTTGYVAEDYILWPAAAQAVLFILMFFGACSGSTGGGIKIIRGMLLAKQSAGEMKYLLHPQGVFETKFAGYVGGRRAVVQAAAGFIALYFMLAFITMLLLAFHGYDILTSLATALATIGNIGPGFGKIGPTLNYAFYPQHIKYFLSFVMVCGRLELFTVLMLFLPRFWQRRI